MGVDDFPEKRNVGFFYCRKKYKSFIKNNLIEMKNVIYDRFVFKTTLQGENNFDSFYQI